MVKTGGIAHELRQALQPLSDRIDLAWIYGSFARGHPGPDSDVDLLVVGEVGFGETVAALRGIQKRLGREINPAVYPSREFLDKGKRGHHFLSTVVEEPKIFLIGDERELARLAEKRLVDSAQNQQTRNQGSPRRRRPQPGRLPDRRA